MAEDSGDRRPPDFSVSLWNLLSFPHRFCHPPHPTASKVRSCSIVPVYQVSLDDVLDRRHLPPLGLKDFEEWLLFVEQRPQYLYFVLWLREYTRRYAEWSKTSEEKTRIGTRPISGSLSIFYTRAKQTFFSCQSPYHLSDIPESTLCQFLQPAMDSPTDSPHPHPSAFTRLESDVRAILSQSLRAFVRAAYANVSTYRAVCGIVGGTVIGLVTGVLPLILAILLSSSRWIRWVGWPGLVVGSTIVIASFHGVCVGIYLFGDARQLRNFELVRPRIEKTPALAITPISPISPSSAVGLAPSLPASPTPAALIRKQWLEQSLGTQKLSSSKISIHSAFSVHSSMSPTATSRADSAMEIYISPAMDPDTGEYSPSASLHHGESHELQEFPRTASFIPREAYNIDEPRQAVETERKDGEETFDFQGLPSLRPGALERKESNLSNKSRLATTSENPTGALKCSTCSAKSVTDIERGVIAGSGQNEDNASQHVPGHQPEAHYGNVPPFGPLTHILSPVVARAQWEVLCRSLMIGAILSLAVVGALVGVPEVKFMTMPVVGM